MSSPNQYYLQGSGISVAYFPDGFGPPHTNGPLHFTYRDSVRSLAFYGDEVRLVEVPDLGAVVSVTIVPSVDTGATTFSLVVPVVVVSNASSSVSIETFGVTTMHYVLVGAIGHPQRDMYAVTALSGVASEQPLPL
jgi:hypothetical protein